MIFGTRRCKMISWLYYFDLGYNDCNDMLYLTSLFLCNIIIFSYGIVSTFLAYFFCLQTPFYTALFWPQNLFYTALFCCLKISFIWCFLAVQKHVVCSNFLLSQHKSFTVFLVAPKCIFCSIFFL